MKFRIFNISTSLLCDFFQIGQQDSVDQPLIEMILWVDLDHYEE